MDLTGVLNILVTATPIVGQEVAEVVHIGAAIKEALAAKGYDAETVELEVRYADDVRRAQLAHNEAQAPPVAPTEG